MGGVQTHRPLVYASQIQCCQLVVRQFQVLKGWKLQAEARYLIGREVKAGQLGEILKARQIGDAPAGTADAEHGLGSGEGNFAGIAGQGIQDALFKVGIFKNYILARLITAARWRPHRLDGMVGIAQGTLPVGDNPLLAGALCIFAVGADHVHAGSQVRVIDQTVGLLGLVHYAAPHIAIRVCAAGLGGLDAIRARRHHGGVEISRRDHGIFETGPA